MPSKKVYKSNGNSKDRTPLKYRHEDVDDVSMTNSKKDSELENVLTKLTTYIVENDLTADELMIAQAEAKQALLKWHRDKARSYVFKLVGKRCEEYEELCPVCEAWGLLDQTLKAIEEDS